MEKSTLVLTQIIFRHGHRAPESKLKYPGDPYANEKYLPFGPDELTLIGRKQCYHFGQKLRERYGNLIGPEYYYGLLDAKSTDRSRAIMTLQLVLAGLFPPTPSSRIHNDLTWQPIPFTTKPLNEDKLIGSVITNMYNHEDSPDFRKTSNSLEVVKCIEEEIKWPVKHQVQSMMIYDNIKSHVGLGYPIPKWCASIYPDKLREEGVNFIQHNFGRKSFLINACGGLIQEINKIMTQKECAIKHNQEKKVPKMFLYSGHDLNLIALLCVFKRFNPKVWPTYCANIAIELHKIDDEFYVRIMLQNGPANAEMFTEEVNIEEIILPNRNGLLKLSEFTSYVLEYFPESEKPFDKQCCY